MFFIDILGLISIHTQADIYIYIYIHIHISIHTHIYIYIYACVHMYTKYRSYKSHA